MNAHTAELLRAIVGARDAMRAPITCFSQIADGLELLVASEVGRRTIREQVDNSDELIARAVELQSAAGQIDKHAGRLIEALKTAHAGEKA